MPAEAAPLRRRRSLLGVHAGVEVGDQLADQIAQFLASRDRPIGCQLLQALVVGHSPLQLLLHQQPLPLGAGGSAGLAAMARQRHHQRQLLLGYRIGPLLQGQVPELSLSITLEGQGQ